MAGLPETQLIRDMLREFVQRLQWNHMDPKCQRGRGSARKLAQSTPLRSATENMRLHRDLLKLSDSSTTNPFGWTVLSAIILIPMFAVGCTHSPRQAMSDLWGAVPQVRWSRTEAQVESKPEPSVVANAAKPVEKNDPLASESPDSSDVLASEGVSEPVELTIEQGKPDAGISSKSQPPHPRGTRSEVVPGHQSDGPNHDIAQSQSDQEIERLKAALTEDAERAKEPARQLSGAHDARVRVESLVERARQLFAGGKLREARHTAQVAQDMGESAHLDYAPDEERPADLIHQIDDQLRKTSQSPASLPADQSPAGSPAVAKANDADSPAQGFTSVTDDSTSKSKSRRDWSYGLSVFRRDRKSSASAPSEPPAVVQTSVAPATEISPVRIELGLESDDAQQPTRSKAVVQANRSVTLDPGNNTVEVEQSLSDESDAAVIRNSGDNEAAPVEDQGRQFPTDRESDPPNLSAESNWLSEKSDESRRSPLEDDSAPPETDDLRPIGRFHDVTRQRPAEPKGDENQTACGLECGGLAALGLFGICGIFAIFWYRRGAT